MNSAFEDDLRQVWRGQNQNILITPQEPVDVPNLSNSECRKFEFTFEEMGTIKRGSESLVKTETRTGECWVRKCCND